MMEKKLNILFIMVAVSTISALLLTAVNELSRDVIKRNQERNLKVAVLNVLNISYDDKNPELSFNVNVVSKRLGDNTFYISKDQGVKDNAIDGIAMILEGPGFWAPISILVGISPDDFSIKGIEILEQLETPGLGARIEEEEFRDQFKGKFFDKKIVAQIKGKAPGPNDVSAITGASLTSKSFENIINKASRKLIKPIMELIDG